jgi:enoyl-CoA hydratase
MSKRYTKILVERKGAVGIVRLNRPEALNALSSDLMLELVDALSEMDHDDSIRCIILTGSDKVFSAGADIKEMSSQSAVEALKAKNLERFDEIQKIGKPIIAAVAGYCFGGGLELAMTCDIIIASEGARLGQPEINIGVMPGAGGTQRLTRAVGKYKAMELILSGRQMTAGEAHADGLVSKIVPNENLIPEALRLADQIASKSPLAVRVAKECILKSYEATLSDGLQYERRNFYLLLSSEDKGEGMRAFMEKRKPSFKGM